MRHLIGKSPGGASERGLTLMIVLIALVSLSMAALALVRSVDTGTLVTGNLGFKQATTSRADSAVETAMAWVVSKYGSSPTDLYDSRCSSGCASSDATSAYYATSLDGLDISGHNKADVTRALIDWDDNNCSYATAGTFASCLKASPTVTVNGFKTRYVIARMCKTTGDPNLATNNCAQPTTVASTRQQINKGETKYGMIIMLAGGGGAGGGGAGGIQMYRVISRAMGPRNTVSYTETYVSAMSQ